MACEIREKSRIGTVHGDQGGAAPGFAHMNRSRT
jgi:hypothetical protein